MKNNQKGLLFDLRKNPDIMKLITKSVTNLVKKAQK